MPDFVQTIRLIPLVIVIVRANPSQSTCVRLIPGPLLPRQPHRRATDRSAPGFLRGGKRLPTVQSHLRRHSDNRPARPTSSARPPGQWIAPTVARQKATSRLSSSSPVSSQPPLSAKFAPIVAHPLLDLILFTNGYKRV